MNDPVHIIGAGLVGLGTADALSERGRAVVVWDAAPAPGMGANYRNSALLHPSQAAPWRVEGVNSGLDAADRGRLERQGFRLAARSVRRIRRRMAELGLPPERRGVLQVFDGTPARDLRLQDYGRLGARAEAASWLGHPAIHIAGDGCADARLYALHLAGDLAERGVEFRLGSRVGLRRGGDGLLIETPSSRTAARQVVVAAGHATPGLLSPLGMSIDLVPVAGHALDFRPSLPPPESVLPSGVHAVMDATSHSALSVLDGTVRLSGSVGLAAPDDLLPIWQALVPGLADWLGSPVSRWTGYRPVMRGGAAFMGGTDVEGLFVNAGHAHMGWTLSAGAGEVVADAVMAEEVAGTAAP